MCRVGGCRLRKFRTAILKKVIACMVWKLTVISVLYKPKPRINTFRYLEHFWQNGQFSPMFHDYFVVPPCLWRHCDVIRWMFVLILACMERGDPWLYNGSNLRIGGGLTWEFQDIITDLYASALAWWYIHFSWNHRKLRKKY